MKESPVRTPTWITVQNSLGTTPLLPPPKTNDIPYCYHHWARKRDLSDPMPSPRWLHPARKVWGTLPFLQGGQRMGKLGFLTSVVRHGACIPARPTRVKAGARCQAAREITDRHSNSPWASRCCQNLPDTLFCVCCTLTYTHSPWTVLPAPP